MRAVPGSSIAVRGAVCAAVYLAVLFGVLTVDGQARQDRSAAQGVYTADQAKRGAALYDAQCASCHGKQLEGVVGPMLAGDTFVAAWSAHALDTLVDKIQKTMPLQAPNSLTREQSIDITAYMLQQSKFPAGATALTDAALATTKLPAPAAAAATPAAGGAVPFAASANLAQVMRGITFPNANVIFNVQVKDPGAQKPMPPASQRGFDYVEWGATIYPGWQAVDNAALALIESTPLFMLPNRRCENGRPVPIDNADYKKWTEDLIVVAREVFRASQARNADAVADLSDKLNTACADCHKKYRDVGTAEGGGLGGDRCRPN